MALPWSLRWRLLAATAVAAAAAVALAGWVLAGLFRDHVTRQLAAMLTAQLDAVTARLDLAPDGAPTLQGAPLDDPRWARPYSGLYWQVDRVAPEGGRTGVLRSRSLWDAQLDAPRDTLADGEVHVHDVPGPGGVRLVLVERTVRLEEAGPRAWRVLVAADRAEIETAAQRFDAALAASLAVLLLLLMVAALGQVQVGLAPLRTLQRSLAAVRAGRATQLAGRFPPELQPLVEDFNGVLARNAEIVERARTQAGNLAHALKTPLAVLSQAADAARRDPDALPTLPSLVREQVDAARRRIDWHLARARAAGAQGVPGLRTPLQPVVAGLARVMARVHAARGLQIDAEDIPADLAFAGESQDLQEMLGNLLDNACLWARGRVHVSAQRCPQATPAALRLIVQDDGPGIDPGLRDQVLARGARLDESVPGSGLGLAIVGELAALYRGSLALGHSPWGGLQAELTLPATPPAQDEGG